jgi:hypothetical protein
VPIPVEITYEYPNNPKDEDRRFFRNLQRTWLYVSEHHILIPIAVINQKLQKDSMAAAKPNVHTVVCHIVEMQYVIKSASLRGLCGSYQPEENPRAQF